MRVQQLADRAAGVRPHLAGRPALDALRRPGKVFPVRPGAVVVVRRVAALAVAAQVNGHPLAAVQHEVVRVV